ncbi:hypothetical protein INP52_02030 [Thermophilibacter immobilis]|uniref:Uncharacterized protein n=1 Tax=Thermophilibacter immobilis TaxID=2779519 RepID=A0A7S7MA27_9ACTN|nr:hypothetical protein INP52_02030 [Thermophilibacter immobilis]
MRSGGGARLIENRLGQSTLEYLLVLVAFVAMVGALGLLWHAARDGRLVELARDAASHGAGQGAPALLKDIVEF